MKQDIHGDREHTNWSVLFLDFEILKQANPTFTFCELVPIITGIIGYCWITPHSDLSASRLSSDQPYVINILFAHSTVNPRP